MSRKKEVLLLACAPADMPFVVPGSDFTHQCEFCATRVMIAPSGQRAMKRFKQVKLVCVHCAMKTMPPDAKIVLPMSLGEMREEASRAVPNLWKLRN
jgi:hypothetical protein